MSFRIIAWKLTGVLVLHAPLILLRLYINVPPRLALMRLPLPVSEHIVDFA